ncbi:putative transcriptional regulator [Caenibius tardaugens NBRC 16725]|uniref:Putative transcriptional regulator n=1 Tax=Caenibius tardaugens NBRC 16725 TaxID=1219035 RepID=U3A252_9SPHN|nr:helix-turn-helix domain-containing protein [Caenibius tardaugens]AZI36111.1 TetR/AcrR family transcriptional regulator [Caenibius tardaugens NBRC 16725]GAD48808.1 putative transcriptional regulator [Caenibius tardaugens NBRC 16725]
MKVSRDRAAENRRAVVDNASRMFRTHGVDGVGIGAIMRESGLTHGGFYAQFGSKEQLAGEACAEALQDSFARWRRIARANPDRVIAALAEAYLSERHRDDPEQGCALVALGADAARNDGAVADAFREGLLNLVGVVEEAVPEAEQDHALAAVAQMVGAMVLARAVHDRALSNRIMAASRMALQKKV